MLVKNADRKKYFFSRVQASDQTGNGKFPFFDRLGLRIIRLVLRITEANSGEYIHTYIASTLFPHYVLNMGNATSSRSKASPKVTPHDKAILQLKLQRDKLHQSKQKIQTVIERENEIVKTCIKSKNLEKAKLTLRKKKRQQSLLDNLEKQSNTLEELIDTIEFKLIEKDVLFGLEQGNKVLKEINSEMSIEKVDRIMEETAEAVEYQNELSERLGSLLTNSEEMEVDEELRALELEMSGAGGESAIDADKVKKLPTVPTGIHRETEEEPEEEEEEPMHEESRVAMPA